MIQKIKITRDQITYGDRNPDEFMAKVIASELINKGYRRTSNAHCQVSRIDREDWIEALAKQMRCCVADFYNKDGSGVGNHWRDHYVRVYSKDNLTVAPEVIKHVPSY